jgi:potassium channel subfamily K, other eukaryote
MGNKEESEWVLERLTATLNRELEEMRKEELEKERGDKGENMTKDKLGEGDAPRTDTIQTITGDVKGGRNPQKA